MSHDSRGVESMTKSKFNDGTMTRTARMLIVAACAWLCSCGGDILPFLEDGGVDG
jgi:hypothetical protein